ncbi:hypothetical protein BHE74_00051549, partial [Ensete ventricosum]
LITTECLLQSGLAKVKFKHRVDVVGNSLGVRRELTEGIVSLPGWRKEVRQKKTETRRKIIGGSRKACQECTTVAQAFRRLTRSDWAVEPPIPKNLGTFDG